MMPPTSAATPRYILMHDNDNVAIVVNDGGLPAGAVFDGGLTLLEAVPQGHKVALRDVAKGEAVIRYNVTIGFAADDLPAGSWLNEQNVQMPDARELVNLPISTRLQPPAEPLEGYTFQGFRNPDGSVGTRNILAITTTVQCVSGVVEFAVKRIKEELLPKYPNVDDVVGLEHTCGCSVAIDAPGAMIPIRTLRNITLNPNFGGQAMVVSLGCEKLQPTRLFPKGSIPIQNGGGTEPALVCLQDAQHVGFMSMIDSIMRQAEANLVDNREVAPVVAPPGTTR